MIDKRKSGLPLSKDILLGFTFLIIFTAMFAASFGLKQIAVARIGPSFVPKIISSIAVLLSLGIIAEGIKKQKKAKEVKPENETKAVKQEKKTGTEASKLTVFISIGLIGLYFAFLNIIGFVISTIIYLFVQMTLLAPKKDIGKLKQVLLLSLIAVVVSLAVYYIFRYGFDLLLPNGILD